MALSYQVTKWDFCEKRRQALYSTGTGEADAGDCCGSVSMVGLIMLGVFVELGAERTCSDEKRTRLMGTT
jgi:hypothetical protein